MLKTIFFQLLCNTKSLCFILLLFPTLVLVNALILAVIRHLEMFHIIKDAFLNGLYVIFSSVELSCKLKSLFPFPLKSFKEMLAVNFMLHLPQKLLYFMS